MHSTLHNILLLASRTSKEQSYRLALFSQSSRFHSSPRCCVSKKSQDGAGTVVSPIEDNQGVSVDEEKTSPSVASKPPAESGVQPLPAASKQFYGSATRRHLRGRTSRKPGATQPISQWFLDENVRLYSELGSETLSYGSHYFGALWPTDGVYSFNSEANWIERYRDIQHLKNKEFADKNLASVDVLLGADQDEIEGAACQNHTIPPRWFLDAAQLREVLLTARGLIELPSTNSSDEIVDGKSHLIIHYAAEGGSFLLDNLVHQIIKNLSCDLISVDAQDIANLVTSWNHPPTFPQELTRMGRLLSYEIYRESTQLEVIEEEPETGDQDPQEMEGDRNYGRDFRPGSSTIFAKPIAINLSDLFRSSKSDFLRPTISDSIFSTSHGSSASKPKSVKHILEPLVEALADAPVHKRAIEAAKSQLNTPEVGNTVKTQDLSENSRNGVIIQVKDLRSIQETPFGKQFLAALYDTAQNNRKAGRRIMIIGTEMSNDGQINYSEGRIRALQTENVDESSSTIVLTPVIPDNRSKLALLEDKKLRILQVNLRHFWEQHRHRELSTSTSQVAPRLWQRRNLEDSTGDLHSLESAFWSFGQIHRLSMMVKARATTDKEVAMSDIHQALLGITGSDQTKFAWAKQEQARKLKSDQRGGRETSYSARLEKLRNSATKYEKRLLSGVIEPSKIRTTFNDVHTPAETINALKTLTTLSLIRPDAFLYGVLASDRIPGLLLYGPPGTGKTLLAKAVAKESGATVLQVSSAEINNMYVGEGEKNVKALFSLATKLSPCVIFIDEADALFSARTGRRERVNHRELINQFLKEWDGMSNDSGGAFIMVATNRPMDLDEAVLRRLPRRLLIDLPNESDRLEILKIHLRDEQLAVDVNLAEIAGKTPFYSGSDLKNLAVAAALDCVREENDLAKLDGRSTDVSPAEKRILSAKHFSAAMDDISASISEDMNSLKEIKRFDEEFGDRRGRRKRAPSLGFDSPSQAAKVLDTVKIRP